LVTHILVVLTALAALAAGCENDIERINLLTDEAEYPSVKGNNIKVIYSDSAKVKVQILAPTFLQFPLAEKPYMEFPDGIEVYFYDDSLRIESEIMADYAIYYSEDRLWQARGNVVAHKLNQGDALYTEELFWNEKEERIYSNVYTRVQNGEDVLFGKGGFEAQQNLENWYLKGTTGEIVVPDEE
jgi:LPS export ABC transporter protein LptC